MVHYTFRTFKLEVMVAYKWHFIIGNLSVVFAILFINTVLNCLNNVKFTMGNYSDNPRRIPPSLCILLLKQNDKFWQYILLLSKKLHLIFHISITKSKRLSLLILLTSVNLSWSHFHRVSVQQSRLLITLVHHGVCVCERVYTIMTGECRVYRSTKAFLLVKSENIF